MLWSGYEADERTVPASAEADERTVPASAEGIDQRVLDEIVDAEISIGDFVLTGGEIPAMAVIDTVARLIPGVLANDGSFQNESHFQGLLEHPQYTKPRVWHGVEVPEVLLSGNHAEIDRWKHEQSLLVTQKKRPDMLREVWITEEDAAFVEKHRRTDDD